MIADNKRLLGIFLAITLLLLIPFIAMQFTKEVRWTLGDFIVAGGLLFGVGLLAELVLRKVKQSTSRIVLLMVILITLLFVWVELAVGIF